MHSSRSVSFKKKAECWYSSKGNKTKGALYELRFQLSTICHITATKPDGSVVDDTYYKSYPVFL